MVLLGTLGLFQAALLPGLALISLFPARHSERLRPSEIFTLGVGLSLAFNYLAVLVLTWAGLNVPASHFLLVFAGGAALLSAAFTRRQWFRETLLPILMVCLAGVVLLAGSYLLRSKSFCVFRGADELLSWNRWALEWAANSFPTNTRHYPQLLPAAWSVIYQLLPQPVDLFAKALMPLFPLGIAATYVALSGLERRSGPLFAVPIALFLLHSLGWSGSVVLMGMADVPSAFTLLLAYYAFTKWRADPGQRLEGVLAGVFAGAALVTKQGGFALLPLFLAVCVRDTLASRVGRGGRLAAWGPFWLVMLAVGLPWYLYAEHQVSVGKNGYDAAEAWIVNGGATFFRPESSALGRLSAGFALLASSLGGRLVVVGLAASCALSLRRQGHRLAVLFMAFGYPLLWACFLSYDSRNLMPAVPFIALGAGCALGDGAQRLFPSALGKIAAAFRTVRRVASPSAASLARVGLLVSVLGLGLLAVTCPQQRILESQTRLRETYLGDSRELNRALYSYFDSVDAKDASKVASYYTFLSALPGLSQRYEYVDLRKEGALESALRNPVVGYVLLVFKLQWREHISEANLAAVERMIRSGTLQPVFRIPDGWLLRLEGARP